MSAPIQTRRHPPITYLFVPANRPERFEKALNSGADAIIIDLEDAVAPKEKVDARAALCDWFRSQAEGSGRVIVRINDENTEWFDGDIAFVRTVGLLGVMMPKAELVSEIALVKAALPESGYVIPIIESARGMLNLDAIATADGVHRLAFGTLDYAVDLDLSGDAIGLAYPACRMALASKLAGIAAPIAGVTANLSNDEALAADLSFARACGFGAKLCIHPKQVAPVRQAFVPSTAELDWAQRVLAAEASGHGAVQIDGKMVDRPVLLKARSILDRAAE